jgi:hypothetical protein
MPVIGNNTLVIGNKMPVIGNNKPVIGNNTLVIGNNKPVIGNNGPEIGKNRPVFGKINSGSGQTEQSYQENIYCTDIFYVSAVAEGVFLFYQFNFYRMKNLGATYVPHKAEDFYDWQEPLTAAISAHSTEWGIDLNLFAPVLVLKTAFVAAYALYKDLSTRTPKVTQDKTDTMDAYVVGLNDFLEGHVIRNRAINNGWRKQLGLPLLDQERGHSHAPQTSPVAIIDLSQSCKHLFSVKDSVEKNRPLYADKIEVQCKVGGEPPVDDSEFVTVGVYEKQKFEISYPYSKVGTVVYYRLRWLGPRDNQEGPWSMVIKVIIN